MTGTSCNCPTRSKLGLSDEIAVTSKCVFMKSNWFSKSFSKDIGTVVMRMSLFYFSYVCLYHFENNRMSRL
jgi:hypothetical protein